MVVCSCGKLIEKVPDWLKDVQVEFICNDCPNRTLKSIAEVKLEPAEVPAPSALGEEGELDEIGEELAVDEADAEDELGS
ncbi:MAG: hypothetical protein IT207_09425 [Fimbriimonadaceae bacterium]|nr:hypothetical protein [Fimbriimonadaceae bacterium]